MTLTLTRIMTNFWASSVICGDSLNCCFISMVWWTRKY